MILTQIKTSPNRFCVQTNFSWVDKKSRLRKFWAQKMLDSKHSRLDLSDLANPFHNLI